MSVTHQLEQQRNQDEIKRAKEAKMDVGVFMLLDQQPSGFIRKGTENQPNPPQLTAPTSRKLLNKSAYAKFKGKDKNGDYDRIPTAYVASATAIEEEKIGNAVRNANNDIVEFRMGMKVVVGEGRSKNLLNFLRKNSQNETCDCRIPGVEAIYKEVFPEAEKETLNDTEFDVADAIDWIRESFITKKSKDGYEYDVEKLNAFCELFDLVAETPAGKVQALIATAKVHAKTFLVKAKQYEQRIYMQIAHGEQLNVLVFSDTNVILSGHDKILVTFSEKLPKDDKVKKLASYFLSAEGRELYNIFLTELDFKAKDSLTN